MTLYPIIRNCNYESDDAGTTGATIHATRKAADAGLTDDPWLLDCLERLEAVLAEHADSGSTASQRKVEVAELAVVDAWTSEVQAEVEASQIASYRD